MHLALLALLLPVYFAVGFSTFYIGALHAPAPDHVKVAIVGPAAEVAPLAQGLSATAKSGVVLSQLSDMAEALSTHSPSCSSRADFKRHSAPSGRRWGRWFSSS
jgi:hypothetical protein